jgi:hypothetical protein
MLAALPRRVEAGGQTQCMGFLEDASHKVWLQQRLATRASHTTPVWLQTATWQGAQQWSVTSLITKFMQAPLAAAAARHQPAYYAATVWLHTERDSRIEIKDSTAV